MQRRLPRIAILLIFTAFVIVACGGTAKPPRFGVFLKEKKQLVETSEFRGFPAENADLPKATDSQPTVVVWLQNLNLDYIVIRDNLGAGNEIAFTAKPVGDDVVEIQAKSPLKAGAYCLVKGDPLASPADVPYYCFQVGDSTTASAVSATTAKQPSKSANTPTPVPGVQQTVVAAAATHLANPGNAATQAVAEQVIQNATATVEAASAARLQALKDKLTSAIKAGETCTARVRTKIEAGDYSEIRSGADLTGCDLNNLNLFGLDFTDVNLSYANLQGANLKGAKFNAESTLERADLRDANLEGVDLSKANTRLAIFSMPLPAGVPVESVARNIASGKQGSMVWIAARAQIFLGGVLYDPESGQRVKEITIPQVSPPSFSPDGKLVAGFAQPGTYVKSVDDEKVDAEYESLLHGLTWAQDQNIALVKGLNGVGLQLWNPVTDQTLVTIDGYGYGDSEALSPNGKQIAADQQEGVVLWNAQTGTKERTLIPGVRASRLSYSPDGRWLAVWSLGDAGLPNLLRVANTDTGEVVLEQETDSIQSFSWNSTSTRFIVLDRLSDPKDFFGLRIWDIASRPSLIRELRWGGSGYPQVDYALDPFGDWIALAINLEYSEPYEILLVNLKDGTEIGADFFAETLRNPVASPDGDYLALTVADKKSEGWSLRLLPVQALLAP